MNKKTTMITSEREGLVLFRLAGPMMLGILGIIVFNLVDTFYVGRLGTVELAALSFTFPVVLVISSIAHGLGVGMTATVSRAAGEENREKQVGLTTWGLLLAFLVVLFFIIVGQLTIDPLFRLLGADEKTLPFIKDYMSIWYWGVAFVIIPMTGNAAIRGLGDTRTPATVMLIAALLNSILDPLFIFGLGPFPALGVKGAAIATVLTRSVTFSVAMYILIYREKVLVLKRSSMEQIRRYWREILHIGIPNTLTKIIVPLSAGIVTGLMAFHGREAVAGFGVSTRLQMFTILPIQALIAILPVFIGQNIGAGKRERVLRGIGIGRNFAFAYGAVIYGILFFTARPIAYVFNSNETVVDAVETFLRIVPLAYGFQGILLMGVTALNVLKKPFHAAVLTLIQTFGIYIPLAFAGSGLLGYEGIFLSLALSFVIMGPVSYKISLSILKKP